MGGIRLRIIHVLLNARVTCSKFNIYISSPFFAPSSEFIDHLRSRPVYDLQDSRIQNIKQEIQLLEAKRKVYIISQCILNFYNGWSFIWMASPTFTNEVPMPILYVTVSFSSRTLTTLDAHHQPDIKKRFEGNVIIWHSFLSESAFISLPMEEL